MFELRGGEGVGVCEEGVDEDVESVGACVRSLRDAVNKPCLQRRVIVRKTNPG